MTTDSGMRMDVKEAVKTALQYVQELFGDEKVINVALEEVEFNDEAGSWDITIGFSRPWDNSSGALAFQAKPMARSYKVVRVEDATGRVFSVKVRTPAHAS